jgi:hypothetical protein
MQAQLHSMTKTLNRVMIAGAIAILGLFAFAFVQEAKIANASAPSGLSATVATTSLQDVGPNLYSSTTPRVIVIANHPQCAARIITTGANPILLGFNATFNGTTTPSGTSGVYQAASTTVAYDSGIYGCGQITAYGYTATTAITITETH